MGTANDDSTKQAWHHPGGKLLRAGPATLTEAELLAIVISSGTAKNPAEKIAAELIEKFQSLRGIAAQPLEELSKIGGLGQVKLCRIAAALEIGRRFAGEDLNPRSPNSNTHG
jgi:DNA repair protein RadC